MAVPQNIKPQQMEENCMTFTPWSDNNLETRGDLAAALEELFNPLVECFSSGGARVKLSEANASFSAVAAQFEGFSRPLWGIVPYSFGGFEFKHWELYRQGLANGTDPDHKEFWGFPNDFDQILVDIAAIGFALCYVPHHIWEPLSSTAKKNVSNYLLECRNKEFCHNNWKFFKVLVDMGLENIGIQVDSSETSQMLDDLESMYLGDGWFGDGRPHRIDYYNGFAFQFYGLIYVHLKQDQDPSRCQRILDRAKLFASNYIMWFADDGASLPYGRSLIYRFSSVGFWGLLALLLDPEETPFIPWGVIKGVYMRNLQWWSQQPIFGFGSKLLTLGYSYPNNFVTERYNSPQSPYWSFKAFSALFMPETHPFWTSKAESLPLCKKYLRTVGMLIERYDKNTVALINGPWNDEYQIEKYSKFAYSTRYGFGVVTNGRTFTLAHLDNMIGFSFNNRDFYVRGEYRAYDTGVDSDGMVKQMYSEWSPVEGIEVKTWILPQTDFHVRHHFIMNNTDQAVYTIEGGFSLRDVDHEASHQEEEIYAQTQTESDISLIINTGESRVPRVTRPEPNSNLIHPKTTLPQLTGTINPRSSVKFSSVVYAQPIGSEVLPEKLKKFGDASSIPRQVIDLSPVTCNLSSILVD